MAGAGNVSFAEVTPAILLNYTGAPAERQLKRSLMISVPLDLAYLLFDGLFTIIRFFVLAVQEGARPNDERGRVGAN
ncbi:MAG: hypothetical protein NTNFB01_09000 [Nitrospira sp.]